jgi:TRAP-type mannitol/chloroaromatic compound transport system permease small subunit
MWKYTGHAHSGLRWLVLVLLVVAILNAFKGWKGHFAYSNKHKKFYLLAMLMLYIQVFIGLIAYYINHGGKVNYGALSDPIRRFFTIDHLFFMLIATLFISLGFRRSNTIKEDTVRFKMIFSTYLIGLALILAGIPWPFRGLGVSGWL